LEISTYTFSDMIFSLLHGLSVVVMAIFGGFVSPPQPPAPRDLPVELRAGDDVFRAHERVTFSRKGDNGTAVISMQLADWDAAGLARFTTRHVGHEAALVVCGNVLMAPRIMEPITGGMLTLTGFDVVDILDDYMRNGCP